MRTKLDIFGNSVPAKVICTNCGKKKSDHRDTDKACPLPGRKDRSGGSSFNEKGQKFLKK